MMSTLAAQFRKLKTSIGGNREKVQFEFTFGQPREEQYHITPPGAWQRRILAQLEFALTLNQESKDEYAPLIRQVLDFLLGRIAQSGAITNEDALFAENMLLPLSAAAREYNLILCAHAHLDMNWMWSWQETVAATLDTLRTMLAIMREYPTFCFSQSQSSVYKIVEDYEPSMMAEIKQRIAEGRWEITSSAWVETDKNMPSTESLVRHILYTKKYLHQTWGVDPSTLQIDFSPDTFGHSRHLPELNMQGGIKYYYHCRGNDVPGPLSRWQAPSGQEVLVYREPYWYNSAITPHIGAGLIELTRRSGGLKTGLIIYGVGDHGGGPTRRDLERALEMQDWPVYPGIRFGTLLEYFKLAEAVRGGLPVVKEEMNVIFPGCYSTQSRIKLGNRQSEAALYNAEAASAIAYTVTGQPYHAGQFEDAWQGVLFTHFHDILTGSCVQDSREHAMGQYSHALAVANTQRAQAMRALSAQIHTAGLAKDEDVSASQSEGAGAGYGIGHFSAPMTERGAGIRRIFHVFNPSAHTCKTLVELTVWDWTGDMRRIVFTDATGQTIPHQLLDRQMKTYWDHQYMRVLVSVMLPPMGYTTIVMDEAELEAYPFYYHPDERTSKPNCDMVLENEHLRAVFCHQSGALLSLVAKADGQELIKPGRPACLKLVQTDGNTDNAWLIGRYMTVTDLTQNVVIKPMENAGELRKGFTMTATFQNSTATAAITLDQGSPAIRMDLTVDWNAFSKGNGPVPTLIYAADVNYDAGQYLYDVPGGSAWRKGMHIDVPALTYGAAVNAQGSSLAIVTDSKYGYRGVSGRLSVTLIHASNSPDPYPECGVHRIKLYLLAGEACPKGMREAAFDVLNAPGYTSARAQQGTLPMSAPLLALDSGTAVISGIKQAEDGSGLIVRLYETAGKPTAASIDLMRPIRTACLVDIAERQVAGDVSIQGGCATLTLAPYAMAAVKLMIRDLR